MKKVSTMFIASLIILGLTVSAKAGYVGRQSGNQTNLSLSPVKIGVGFNKQIAVDGTDEYVTPADLSLRVYAGKFGGELDLGGNRWVTSEGNSAAFDLGIKLFYSVISKSFVKFNAGLAYQYSTYSYPVGYYGLGSYVIIGNGINVIAGPEFFIPQLPELGFNVEVGFGYNSYSYNDNRFQGDDLGTRGFDFLQAGIHYYFD